MAALSDRLSCRGKRWAELASGSRRSAAESTQTDKPTRVKKNHLIIHLYRSYVQVRSNM